MKRLGLFLLAMVLVLSLAACAGEPTPEKEDTGGSSASEEFDASQAEGLAGRWDAHQVLLDGQTLSLAEYEDETGESLDIYFTFRKNGEVDFRVDGDGRQRGTYERSRSRVTVRVEGDWIDLALDEDTLTMKQDGISVILYHEDAELPEAEEPDNELLGTWVAYEARAFGVTLTLDEYKVSTGEEMELIFTFYENGKVDSYINVDGDKDDFSGTYKTSGKEVVVSMGPGDTVTMKMEGGDLMLEMDGVQLFLHKEGAARANTRETGGSGTSKGLVGTWTAKTAKMSGMTLDLDQAPALLGESIDAVFTFDEDGKVRAHLMGEDFTGTYKTSGDTITITINGESEEITVVGDTLHWYLEDDILLILEKEGGASSGSSSSGSSGVQGDIIGKWTAYELEAYGMTISMDEFNSLMDLNMYFIFDFGTNGKVQVSFEGQSESTDYYMQGNRVIMDELDGLFDMTLEGNTLILDYEGMIIRLKK